MSLKIYIDTNIFLNSILNRDNEISKEVLYFLEAKNFEIVLNDISIINIHYYISKDKQFNSQNVKQYINTFLEEYTIVSADTELLKKSLHSTFKDFEDGVQYYCAKEIKADLIITNDKKGFIDSDIETINANNFYHQYVKS